MKDVLEEILSSLHVVALPLTTKFRGIDLRETAIFQGPFGWGEFAPFLEYDDVESRPWLESAIEQAFSDLPRSLRNWIPINGTIPATNSQSEIETLVDHYLGAKVFKVKVGNALPEDLVRVARVRSCAPQAKIRLDVNGAWSFDEALRNIRAFYGEVVGEALEYVEQPVATLDELRLLKEKLQIDVKIAGDEILRKARDPFAIDLKSAVDVLMLKVAPLGGIKRSLELARHHGIPVVVSSALESAVGISHGLRLAACLENLEYACGLATGVLFTHDLGTHTIVNGEIEVKEISPEGIERYEVSAERLEWWKDRIKRIWQVMS